MITGSVCIVTSILLVLKMLGFFSEETTLHLFLACFFSLLFLKFFGQETIIGFFILIAGTVITTYNISITGHIFSFNHKWFLALILLVNIISSRFTFSYIIFSICFQFYSYSLTSISYMPGLGTKEDYMFDNIAYIVVAYIFLLIFKKLQDLQTLTIDKKNAQLLAKQKALMKSNLLLHNRSEQLVASNEELERFAYIASHDLKTPLNNIISFCGLLDRELKHYDNEKATQYFGFIKEGSNRMNALIKDLLEYSKMSGNEMKDEEIDLNELVHSIVDSISEYLNEKNAKVFITSHLPVIKANRTQIYLLYKNLIENGIKYNKSPQPVVEIGVGKKEKQFDLYIKDNGIGIPEKYHESIFQMFSRLHNNSEYEGTGLGLALSKKIVDNLKGKLTLESKSNEGSTFIITLSKSQFIDYASSPSPSLHPSH